MVSPLTKQDKHHLSKKNLRSPTNAEEGGNDKIKKSSATFQSKPTTKISKTSIQMQIESMTMIFSKPIEEREKSDKEKIV